MKRFFALIMILLFSVPAFCESDNWLMNNLFEDGKTFSLDPVRELIILGAGSTVYGTDLILRSSIDKKEIDVSSSSFDKNGINYDELDYYEPSFISYVIDKTTICQCTGIKDKNGKLIWENDIVRIVGHASDVNGVYKIIFDEINHCWALERSYDYPRSYFTFSDLNGFAKDCEVIGNIFDNPELLNE